MEEYHWGRQGSSIESPWYLIILTLTCKASLPVMECKASSQLNPRTKGWLLSSSPFPLLAILLTYNIFCIKVGPMMMKNRPAFKLIMTMKLYNICQVILNTYLFYEGIVYLSSGNYNFNCAGPDETPAADLRLTPSVQLYLFTKLADLLDTVFFVLRKSYRQINFLHLYHHNIMPIIAWIAFKYLPGGQGCVVGTINCFVHVLMYTYYLLSAMGPQYQKFLWWKKYLTVIQIVQFLIILIHSSNSLFYRCDFPFVFKLLSVIESIVFIFMFSNFYYLNYIKEPARNRNKTCVNKETTPLRPHESFENNVIDNSRMNSNKNSNGNNSTYDKSGHRNKSKRL